MAIALYMDEHIPASITEGLQFRGIDVLTAQDDSRVATDDSILLDRAMELGRVMFSEDADMLSEAARRQRACVHFSGLIHTNLQKARIGYYISELELICRACDFQEFANAVQYI